MGLAKQQHFYRTEQDWDTIYQHLKQTPCPHCQTVGMLFGHGFLRGYDDTSPRRKTVRARRILCSNRKARHGCGKTFSVWLVDKIRRLSLTTGGLWNFLQHAVSGSVLGAMDTVKNFLSVRTWQRIWQRFRLAQSDIRTALSGWCPPPPLPAQTSQRPETQVIAHLQAAFPDADCPIAAFQQATHTFFL